MRISNLVAIASALAQHVNAQSEDDEASGTNDLTNFHDLASFFKERSNATVSKTFKGHDLSKRFSADAKADTDWEAVFQIASGVTQDEYSKATGTRLTKDNGTTIMKRIGMWPKNSKGAKDDNDWAYCTVTASFPFLKLPIDEPVNGDCTGVFPEKCLNWLQDLAKNGTACHRYADTEPVGYSVFDDFWPEECKEILKAQSRHISEARTLLSGNLTDVVKNGGVGRTFRAMHTDSNDLPYWYPEDPDYYEAINEVWVMMIGWEKAIIEYTGQEDYPGIKEEDMAEGSLVCLRVEDFAEGSMEFADGNVTRTGNGKDEDEDSASVRGVGNAFVGITAALAVLIGFAL